MSDFSRREIELFRKLKRINEGLRAAGNIGDPERMAVSATFGKDFLLAIHNAQRDVLEVEAIRLAVAADDERNDATRRPA